MAATLSADQEQVSPVFPIFAVLLMKALLTLVLVERLTRRPPISGLSAAFWPPAIALDRKYVGASPDRTHS